MDVCRWKTALCHFGSSPWHQVFLLFLQPSVGWRDLGVEKVTGTGSESQKEEGESRANPLQMTKVFIVGGLELDIQGGKW